LHYGGAQVNKKLLLILICFGMIAGTLYYLWPPLPAVTDIKSIQVTFFLEGKGKDVRFDLPQQYWKSLWNTLLPSRKDWLAANWLIFGDLDIKLKNGDNFRVTLYWPSEGAGAFSAGPTFESRSYYRGGNSEKMIEVINQAYKDTIQTKP
jgi:hypothetical protein